MPKRKEARTERRQRSMRPEIGLQGPAHMSGGARNILVRVSSETWAALETIAQGRTPRLRPVLASRSMASAETCRKSVVPLPPGCLRPWPSGRADHCSLRLCRIAKPCNTSGRCEGYLFWDQVHPTTQAHQCLAEAALRALSWP